MPISKDPDKKAKQMANLEKGKWLKGQSGNPNGRPKKFINRLADAWDMDFNVSLSKEEMYLVLQKMLELSVAELMQIFADDDAPVFMVVAARAINHDISKGKMTTVNELLDRFYGKSEGVSKVDITTQGQAVFQGFEWIPTFPDEEE